MPVECLTGIHDSLAHHQRFPRVVVIDRVPGRILRGPVTEADLDSHLVRGSEQRDQLLVVRKSALADFDAADVLLTHLPNLRRDLRRIRGCGHVHPHPRPVGGGRVGK